MMRFRPKNSQLQINSPWAMCNSEAMMKQSTIARAIKIPTGQYHKGALKNNHMSWAAIKGNPARTETFRCTHIGSS
jgi:hypothetical protein